MRRQRHRILQKLLLARGGLRGVPPHSPFTLLQPSPPRQRVSGVPSLPFLRPHQSPRRSGKESCAQELVPALSSRLAPSVPALLLPVAAAGPEPYLTTAAKDEDEEAAGAAGGGAGVLRWPWDAADGDDDEAAVAARPGPGE